MYKTICIYTFKYTYKINTHTDIYIYIYTHTHTHTTKKGRNMPCETSFWGQCPLAQFEPTGDTWALLWCRNMEKNVR